MSGSGAGGLYHANDPATSRAAAAAYDAGGKRGRHKGLVLALVRRHPGLTACELWAAATPAEQADLGEMQRVRQRLTDLLNAGEVRQAEKRQCRQRGTAQVTWRPPTLPPPAAAPTLFDAAG